MCALGGLTLSANTKEIYYAKKRNRAGCCTKYLSTTRTYKSNYSVTTTLFISIFLLNALEWVEGFQQPTQDFINRRLGNSCQHSKNLRFAVRKKEREGSFILDLTGNDDILSGDKTSREPTYSKRVNEVQSLKDGQNETIMLDTSTKSDMYSREYKKLFFAWELQRHLVSEYSTNLASSHRQNFSLVILSNNLSALTIYLYFYYSSITLKYHCYFRIVCSLTVFTDQ